MRAVHALRRNIRSGNGSANSARTSSRVQSWRTIPFEYPVLIDWLWLQSVDFAQHADRKA